MPQYYLEKLTQFGLSYRYPLLATVLAFGLILAALDARRRAVHLRWAGAAVLMLVALEVAARSVQLFGWIWLLGLPILLLPIAYGVYLATNRSFQQAPTPVREPRRPAAPEALAPPGTVHRIRSVAEEHLFMDFHPCVCGEADWSKLKQSLSMRGQIMASVFAGPCQRCGTRRELLFTVLEPGAQPRDSSFGGPEPSQILDPGQFLAASDRWSSSVPGSAAGLDNTARRRAAATMKNAIAAMEEVLKFIPPGAEEPPKSAFRSSESSRLLREMPGQFRKPRLEARLKAYQAALAQLEVQV